MDLFDGLCDELALLLIGNVFMLTIGQRVTAVATLGPAVACEVNVPAVTHGGGSFGQAALPAVALSIGIDFAATGIVTAQSGWHSAAGGIAAR